MNFEAPSEHAIELYFVAMRAIALAGIYSTAEVGWVIGRLGDEQGRYTRDESDWSAFERMKEALLAAAM